ncbi:MAG: lipid-A-disaccharide synthase [Candidatus Solibacter sp.]|nr:lipid-A-disaccharide synthase [Candidatus Solibacter sp.]
MSAGESSGDRYAAALAHALRALLGDVELFGCAGQQMTAAGVRPVVDMASLAVAGIVEVLRHIPRIYGEYRKLIAEAERLRPAAAILTDSPDFHLRVASRLHRLGIPVFYLVAPQAWAWREGRVKQLQRNVKELYCIFPFEEKFFRQRGVEAFYIGHPLSRLVRPSLTRRDFFAKHGIPEDRPLITLCPGSRTSEAGRHLPALADAISRIRTARECTFLLATPEDTARRFGPDYFTPFLQSTGARLISGETWDALAHAGVALPASGTVTIETALLGTPMVTYYKVTQATWILGRPLVNVPFYSMVNLVAQSPVVPELIQNDMTGERIAAETATLLDSPQSRQRMIDSLARVSASLATAHDPIDCAAARIAASIKGKR